MNDTFDHGRQKKRVFSLFSYARPRDDEIKWREIIIYVAQSLGFFLRRKILDFSLSFSLSTLGIKRTHEMVNEAAPFELFN